MCLLMQPFQPPPPGPSLAGWMANAAASSSVQSAVVAASSIPVPPNQGIEVWCHVSLEMHLVACFECMNICSFFFCNSMDTLSTKICSICLHQRIPETIGHVKLQFQAYNRCC